MGAMMRALLDLQEIELQLVDIRRELDRKQRQVSAQQARLETARHEYDARHESTRRLQMQFDELDVEIKARSAHIDKLRQQLNTVRTNKEYAALLSQMNNEKADLSKYESRAMQLMEEVEARKRELAATEQHQQGEAGRLGELRTQHEQSVESLSGRLERLTKQRDEAAARLDSKVVEQFNRLSTKYGGEAMAELQPADPRRTEFVCGGCFMSKRADIVNALRLKDELVFCKSCGRILYLKDEA